MALATGYERQWSVAGKEAAMGDLRSGNGGTPDDNGSHSREPLPDFPADWGPVIIPDDASELEADRAALHKERRRQARRNRLRALTGRPPVGTAPGDNQSVGVPLMIMAVAVLVTLVSLFVVTWARGPAGSLTQSSTTNRRPDSTSASELSDISLTDTVGAPVRLGSVLPAIVLLVDGCACTSLVNDLAKTAPAGVNIVPVARTVPSGTSVAANIRPLADPNGQLAGRFPASGPSGTATAVLLDKGAKVTSTVLGVDSPDKIKPAQLAQLATH
jgi:hypothetical protein